LPPPWDRMSVTIAPNRKLPRPLVLPVSKRMMARR